MERKLDPTSKALPEMGGNVSWEKSFKEEHDAAVDIYNQMTNRGHPQRESTWRKAQELAKGQFDAKRNMKAIDDTRNVVIQINSKKFKNEKDLRSFLTRHNYDFINDWLSEGYLYKLDKTPEGNIAIGIADKYTSESGGDYYDYFVNKKPVSYNFSGAENKAASIRSPEIDESENEGIKNEAAQEINARKILHGISQLTIDDNNKAQVIKTLTNIVNSNLSSDVISKAQELLNKYGR